MNLILKKFLFLPTILLMLSLLPLQAQDIVKESPLFKKALTEYKEFKFVEAIKNLKQVLEKDSNNITAKEIIAASYRNIRNYDEALNWYSRLVKHESIKPQWALNYAQALASNGQYEESEQWFRKYYELMPSDKRAAAFANANINDLLKIRSDWDIFYTNLNTENSEYSPIYYKNGLLFSSNRTSKGVSKFIFPWDQTSFTDLFIVDSLKEIKEIDGDNKPFFNGDLDKEPYKLNDDDTPPTSNDNRTIVRPPVRMLIAKDNKDFEVRPVGGNINTNFHEGPSALLPDGSLIFTRNNYNAGRKGISSDGITKLKLFTAKGPDWRKIVEFPYNSDEYSVGHPTVNKEGDILIFASDIPGGFGGTDLYYSVRIKNGRWGRPVNLGKRINTEGDEQFPYLDNKGTLYFSSNGHPGLGGLDIFEVPFADLKVLSKPRHLGVPVNSEKDDFGFVLSSDGQEGFLSSNRKGSDDIYRLIKQNYKLSLQGTVIDARKGFPLPESKVVIYHPAGTDTVYTNQKGEFTRSLEKNTDYELDASKRGYLNGSGSFTTANIKGDSALKVVIRLQKPTLSQDFIFTNCDSLKRAFAVNDIYYDLDEAEIREDAKPALNKLALLMVANPEISIISASHCDTRASVAYNKNLSLRRGHAAKSYLINKGVNPSRIKVEYYGKSKLVNKCTDGVPCSEADQQLNRRTEFQIIVNGVNLSTIDCNP